MDNREERIRQKANELWKQAGRPNDSAEKHRAEAARLIDKDDHKHDTDELANEPSPPEPTPPLAVDIGPGPDGNIHTIPGGRR